MPASLTIIKKMRKGDIEAFYTSKLSGRIPGLAHINKMTITQLLLLTLKTAGGSCSS
jgi:hypothetical protein